MSESSDEEDALISERTFRERINFDYEEYKFQERFRVNGEILDYLESRLNNVLAHPTNRNYALTTRNQIFQKNNFLVVIEWHIRR